MPMERAVPSTIFMAPSMSMALRSGILVWAISRTWARVTLPTFSRGGSGGAFLAPGALQHEGEAAVLVDGDLDRDHVAGLGLGGRVVLLAEVHDVHGVGAEGRSHRRRRGGLAGRELDLEDGRHAAATTCLGWHVVTAP